MSCLKTHRDINKVNVIKEKVENNNMRGSREKACFKGMLTRIEKESPITSRYFCQHSIFTGSMSQQRLPVWLPVLQT